MKQAKSQDRIARMGTGGWVASIISVVANLGLADRLAHGPRTAEQLALDTATRARPLHRLLRYLASVGILAEDAGGRFSLTEPARTIRREFPGSQRALAVMMGEDFYHAWDEIFGRFCADKTPIDHLDGKPIFEFLGTRLEKVQAFDDAMAAFTPHTPKAIFEGGVALAVFNDRTAKVMLEAYDLSRVRVLADIGCGNGSNLIAALCRHPEMRGVLFDLPHVFEGIGKYLTMVGLTGRCTAIVGDFFDTIPVEADAYFLRHILHEWDDAEAALILRNVGRSMPERARLLVVEHVLPQGDTPSLGKLRDLTTLVDPVGVERTLPEFRELFEAAGFRLTGIVPFWGDLSVIEGERRAAP